MAIVTDTMEIKGLMDTEPPFGVHLSGIYKKSFAYVTIKDRLPVILTKVIDTMSRDKEEIIEKFGPDATEELKQVIGDVSKLKSELMTNKRLTPLSSAEGDARIWNEYLRIRGEAEGPNLTWFNTTWLLCECYMYRRINQSLDLTRSLRSYDPFEKQKQLSFQQSTHSMSALITETQTPLIKGEKVSTEVVKSELVRLLKHCLWGNRCDLSLSAGAESSASVDAVKLLDTFDGDIVVDDTNVVCDLLVDRVKKTDIKVVDVVLDNAGFELVTDMCLAAFLMTHKFAQKVRFYVKQMPWFVSDVTLRDFYWTIDALRQHEDPCISQFGKICKKYLKTGVWFLEVNSFWTEPYDFGRMKDEAPKLYKMLGDSHVVLFKGDLNYRKLMGDTNFEHTKTLESVLRESGFHPTNIVTIRTVKSDVCVGLAVGKAQELQNKDKNWMTTGQYGVINAVSNVTEIFGGDP